MRNIILQAYFILLLASCSTGSMLMQSILVDDGLSENEIIEGLKTALSIGTDKAINIVSKPDGYLEDQAIKILLPSEFNQAIEKLRNAPGGEQIYQATISSVVKDLIIAMNRSASDAAPQAIPIFKNAITSMTIQDGLSILNGDYKNSGDQSATKYFKDKTQEDLIYLFNPIINKSLEKPLIANTSANKLWDAFILSYNAIYNSPANLFMKLQPVNDPDLSSYVTRKALDGLFIKIADEEQAIRDDPYQYANSLIEKVFGDIK